MKGYLLDISLVAAFLHGRPHILTLIEPLVKKRQAGTSLLVYGEVMEYLKGRDNQPEGCIILFLA
jgi:hypothetical protein